ncbi:MAG: ATP-binding protein [Muribaculaceae bacterium]|nr:ATP-binding protein [Muribaculaceae bacterium]
MIADNPWWINGSIFDDFDALKPRMFLKPFLELVTDLPDGRSVLLLGPRRVGKTVMIFHTIRELLKIGVAQRKIFYLTVDAPLYSGMSLEEMVDYLMEASKADGDNDGYYIFFDEIQYLKDWEIHLKVLCDTYRHIRFIASGSAAAALKMKSIESGAGRFTHFSLPPLLFCEYLSMIGEDNLVISANVEWFGSKTPGYQALDVAKLNEHFIDYLNFGGYPEVVTTMQLRNNPGRYIKEDIVDKVLLKDLPGLYGISDSRDLYRLFIHLVYRSGEEFSFEDLSKESGIRKDTLKRYVDYLESAFLIRVLHKIDENARRFQRVTTFKIFVTNPSIFAAIFSPLNQADAAFNHLVETTVFSQLGNEKDDLYFANWKKGRISGEVDFVRLGILSQKPERAVEVKWSDRYYRQPGELKSLLAFMETNKLSGGVVTTISETGSREMGCGTLHFVPTSLYAYTKGIECVK